VPIIAGIDEAGYGPLLGPLFTSCVALRSEAPWSAGPGELWERLEGCVGRNPGRPRKGGGRILVGDSKRLYASGGGLTHLERATLAFLALRDGAVPARPEELFRRTLTDPCRQSLSAHPWYADRGEGLPLDCPREELVAASCELAALCARRGVGAVTVSSRALAEGEFNRRVRRLDNKASALLELVAELLADVRAAAGSEPLEVHVDRLGGRTDYAPLLSMAFPGAFVWQETFSAAEQRYRLEGLPGPTVVAFRVRADGDCFSTALASMASKYQREILMRRFNAWWRERVPELPATSGYHADAGDFLAALAPHRERLGVAEDQLVRCR
jgi:hypothetical protein